MKAVCDCGPLSHAILRGDGEEIERLLDNHLSSTQNEGNFFGQTPLHLAAGTPSYLDKVLQYISPEMLRAVDHAGRTPLHYAMQVCQRDCEGTDKSLGDTFACPVRCAFGK